MKKYILALDQGTTSSRAILFDHDRKIRAMAQKEFKQIYPVASWVEHNPMEILSSQLQVMEEVLSQSGVLPEEIAGIGITNQRETTIVWHKKTGKPVYNAIVWQCRRTADLCDKLKAEGHEDLFKASTGLVIDAYFSATKIKWILDHVQGARQLALKGELLFGTVDSWLVWNLTAQKNHVTDYSNASRTLLYNIHELHWDPALLRLLDIPESLLPQVKSSSEVYGFLDEKFLGAAIPIAGIAGDQQAALFGQTCFKPGMAKNTYGTGCFILMNTGEVPVPSSHGLLTTIAWGIDGRITYALEGSVFMGGATIQWLRDELGLIQEAKDSAYYASRVLDNGGVYLVPAFTGLGAPYWDMYARGTLVGLTRGTGKNHIIRAALESIAYQSADVIHAMEEDSPVPLCALKVDGGATGNDWLLQFQSDILGTEVIRPRITESTALGAATLAGLAVGFYESIDALLEKDAETTVFTPLMPPDERQRLIRGWHKAVDRSKNWAD
ncbi:MAG: glycerol kinase [delta proteobacterium ML8_F1]|nr:MAG: glycerol kinase [delta proteobacterium ML8_F1]